MADEKTINTRIQLKYDILENWTEANPVLKAGEVAIVAIPTDTESTVEQVTKPAIVFKVGDGASNFNNLPYASGLAADVYAWAKAEEKPSYSLDEIEGWNDSVDEEVSSLITSALTKLLESEDFANAVIKDVTTTVEESLQEAETYTDTSIAGLAGENGVSVTSGSYITGISVKESTEEEIGAGASKYVLELIEEALPTTDLTNYYTKEEVDEELEKKQDTLTFDEAPIAESTNPVTSGGIYTAISEAIDGVTQFDFEVVDELPAKGEKGVIYLLKCEDTTHKHDDNNDVYDEYIWMDDKFEKIGNTAIDLSDYVTDESLKSTLVDYVTTTAMDEKAEEVKTEIESEISTLTESVETVSDSLNELNSSVNDLSGAVTSQEESISSLNEQINGSDNDSDDTGLVGDVSTLQKEVEALQTSVTDTRTYDVTSTVTGETEETATGLKITTTTTTKGENGAEENKTTFNVEFDKDVVFVFNCGDATLEEE